MSTSGALRPGGDSFGEQPRSVSFSMPQAGQNDMPTCAIKLKLVVPRGDRQLARRISVFRISTIVSSPTTGVLFIGIGAFTLTAATLSGIIQKEGQR